MVLYHLILCQTSMVKIGEKKDMYGSPSVSLCGHFLRPQCGTPAVMSVGVVHTRNVTVIIAINHWLVVWNIFCFPIYWK